MSIDTDYAVLRTILTGSPNEGVRTFGPLPEPAPGWAVEFGVYSGTSLQIISQHMPVIGFDSFKGLPEDWREGFPMGAFKVDSDHVGNFYPYYPNAMIVPGWFSNTLTGFPFPSLSLVHMDCDLYSSTMTALDAIENHLDIGTIIVFDEFHGYPGWEEHEARAWEEFHDRANLLTEPIAEGEQEMAFVVTGWVR